jgi:holo-[acyl-carrier protein] synthase
MVLGVGTDLIETRRIQESIERYGERFLERVFTAGETAYCMRKKKNAAESFAARFAAKELEVRREASGRPTLHLSGRAAELAKAMGVRRIQLSLTHSRELAMAVVVAED